MKQLDLLFVIPGNLSQVYQTFAKEHHTEPPAKARQIAAYLMRRGFGVDLLDSAITNLTPELMAQEVVAREPHLVWIPVYGFNPSSSTQTMPAARAYAQAIKDLDPTIPIVFSGTHPAAIPRKTLEDEPVDYVCSGEGPITAHELLRALENGEGIERVCGLWRKQDGGIVANPPAPLIDLSMEPAILGWSLMDPRRYQADGWHTFYRPAAERMGYANPFSVEGCPFKCDFCNIQSPFRDGERAAEMAVNSYRFLAPHLFVEEVEYLANAFGIKYFKIPDEMFALKESHVLAIADGIAERFGDALDFWCYARVDTAGKPRMLEACRAAGIRWFGVGVEAGNAKVRSGQDKKFKDDDIPRVIEKINRAGIEVGTTFIFGLPGDDRQSMEDTYRLACELNTPFTNFYCTQALPGSALYARAKGAGYPLPERLGGPGWIGHSQYAYECEPFYEGTALKPYEILAFRDWAHVDYFTRSEFREMLLTRPGFGEVALQSIDRWVDGVRGLRRKIIEQA